VADAGEAVGTSVGKPRWPRMRRITCASLDERDETQTPPARRARQHIEAEAPFSAHSRFVRGRVDAGAVSGSVRVSDATTSPARSSTCDRPMRDRQAARAPSTP